MFLVRYKERLGSLSSLQLYYSIASKNLDDLEIQTSFCALMDVLVISTDVSARIGETGGIAMIIKAMRRHKEISLHGHACSSLLGLIFPGANKLF